MARLTREMRKSVMLLLSSFDMALHSPNASRSREMHGVGQSEEGLPRLRNLLICIGMANRKTVLQIKLPACRCQHDGRLPVSWHAENGDRDGKRRPQNGCRDYAEPRVIPSFCILNCNVDRFMARCAAAPFGPDTTQSDSLRALRISWRSVSSRTLRSAPFVDLGEAGFFAGRSAFENLRSLTSIFRTGPVEIITARSITF